jgi:predicted nucleotidyltransferase
MEHSFLAQVSEVLKEEGVLFAYLFGSQASGKTGKLSDIDIAVYFKEDLTPGERFDKKLKIMARLSLLLKRDDIDVVVLNDSYLLMEHRIIKEGKVIFSVDERKRLDYEVRAVMRYLDFKPYLEKHTKEILYG